MEVLKRMKKLFGILLVLGLLLAPSAFALREEDKSNPIANFNVYKRVSPYASNEVAVLTVNSGQRGYVTISVTTEDKYAEGLAIARILLKTKPDQLYGTKFAYRRARI